MFCTKTEQNSQVSTPVFPLETVEKEEQTKPKASRRKETVKNIVEINETKIRKTKEKINEITNWFNEKINKIDKPLK